MLSLQVREFSTAHERPVTTMMNGLRKRTKSHHSTVQIRIRILMKDVLKSHPALLDSGHQPVGVM